MPDVIISENLMLIVESLDLINKRFASINQPDDLVLDESGVIILDSIAMRLQVVGELLKKIDKKNSAFLKKYSEINWDNIMKLRDIVSHHYEKVDHEIIFDICKNHLPKLIQTVQKMLLQ
ncbi:HepT-like ribonuclease domain-containing protein [Desulfobacula sp.]